MNIAVPADLAAIPERLTALLQGLPDPDIDAEVAEAMDDWGLFAELDGEAKQTALHFYRIEMLAKELAGIADALTSEADGTAARQAAKEAARDAKRAAGMSEQAICDEELAAIRARLRRNCFTPCPA